VQGAPVSDLPSQLAAAKVTGKQARHTAVRDIAGAEADGSRGDVSKQVVYTTSGGTAHRAWQTVTSPDGQGMWLHIVDAASGLVLYRQYLSSDLRAADTPAAAPDAGHALSSSTVNSLLSGKALVWDYSPGAATGGEQQTRHLDLRGWLPLGAKTLDGPIAHVYSDTDDNDMVDDGEEITPATDGTFSFPFKPFTGDNCGTPLPCSWDQKTPNSWQTNRKQNAAQVYYFLGKYHDHLQAAPIGFTRAAGNFDGRDGDALQAQTDDGAAMKDGLPDDRHLNNANMTTPPDGYAPTMQMYLTGPQDGHTTLQGNWGDDASTVYHEYTHGLSNRLVVDADGVSTLVGQQGWAMGEGWSDWYALDFLSDQGLLKDSPLTDGEVTLDPPHWTDDQPSRTQPVDCPVGSASPKCPGTKTAGAGGYTYGDYGKIFDRGPEPHADGEIWGETLWDLRAELGSRLTESLVTRAMELSPADPSFLDQRNAILQADTVTNGGLAHDRIWKVFAHRGMGYFAAALTTDDTKPDEDFSPPPGPDTPRVTLTGKVTDNLAGTPGSGITVSISGHNSGFPGADLSAVTTADGTYTIADVPEGTYRKVYASGAGYEPQIRTIEVGSGSAGGTNWQLRRDWAASAGGAKIADFNSTDYSQYGCGPDGVIDLSEAPWFGDVKGGTNGTGIDPVHATVKLPRRVDIRELRVDPTGGQPCGRDLTVALGDYQIETSPDGTTWTTAAKGHFKPADTGRQNTVLLAAGSGKNVQYIRLTMLGNQTADHGVDCAQDPPMGCYFVGVTELVVHGTPHQS
jgi:extracellular elastinolytic metalloproteinase